MSLEDNEAKVSIDITELQASAKRLGFTIAKDDENSFLELVRGSLAAASLVAGLEDFKPEVEYNDAANRAHEVPSAADNRMNAWYVKTNIRGSDDQAGKLSGKRVVIKDNVCVASVPMTNGSLLLRDFVADMDATVVARILRAGGTIAGKSHCEDLCFSGGSHTNCCGPVRNPHNLAHATGGSSSGSAALVAAGEVDMAIGGDQGGSIRIPASWCGVCGMKPTWGLVPYTGAFPIEHTIDHLGPITKTVADNALLLEAIAGVDGLDARQTAVPLVYRRDYTDALGQGVRGMKIAMVTEGFEGCTPEVVAAVRAAAEYFKNGGAVVADVSIDWHAKGTAVWSTIALEGAVDQLFFNASGTGHRGYHPTKLIDEFAAKRAQRADGMADTVKVSVMVGDHLKHKYMGHFYAKGQNLSMRLRKAYDDVLVEYDLLLMPTLPMVATKLPAADASREDVIARAFEMIGNTAPFDATGHPAVSVPCGKVDSGLPVGMMLVGRHFDEYTIYRAAAHLEKARSD